MKKQIFTILLLLSAGLFSAQNRCNVTNLAKIPLTAIRSDGATDFPYFNEKSFRFSNSGTYLFVAWGSPRYGGGGVMVYNTQTKTVVKNFKIEPREKNNYEIVVAVNPVDEKEIAIHFAPKEMIVLPNWQEEPEYALSERKKAFETKRVIFKAKSEWWNWHYSADGSFIYNSNSSGVGFIAYDKLTGEPKKKKEFSASDFSFLLFSENDLALVFKSQRKKDIGVKLDADVYNVGKDSIIRSVTLPDMRLEFGLGGNRYLGRGKVVYDVLDDSAVEEAQKLFAKIFDDTKEVAEVYTVPNLDKSQLVYKSTTKKGFISSCNTPVLVMTGFQASPDGRFFVYGDPDKKELVIWQLY